MTWSEEVKTEAQQQLADAKELVRLCQVVVAKLYHDDGAAILEYPDDASYRIRDYAGEQSLEALREQQQHTLNDLVRGVNGEKVYR